MGRVSQASKRNEENEDGDKNKNKSKGTEK
jgi:hypothetical protein